MRIDEVAGNIRFSWPYHAVGGDLPRAREAAGVVPRRAGERGGRALEPYTRSRFSSTASVFKWHQVRFEGQDR